MSSRARAPQTAHLRKLIRKTSHKTRTKNRRENDNTQEQTPAILRDTHTHHWHQLSSMEPPGNNVLVSSLQPPPHSTSTMDSVTKRADRADQVAEVSNTDVDALCQILSKLACRFQEQGRLYCSFAATAAVALVRSGQQDCINAGLWYHINHFQTEKEDEHIAGNATRNG